MVEINNIRLLRPDLPVFSVSSESFSNGEAFKLSQLSGILGINGAKDMSPQLTWSGAPKNTKSYAIMEFDPDEPTGSGFWHWVVFNIPATVTELPENAGDPDSNLMPKEAVTLRNDAGYVRYIGSAPPPGDGLHHYFFTVFAVDIEKLDVPPDSNPAKLGLSLFTHAIGRATIMAVNDITP